MQRNCIGGDRSEIGSSSRLQFRPGVRGRFSSIAVGFYQRADFCGGGWVPPLTLCPASPHTRACGRRTHRCRPCLSPCHAVVPESRRTATAGGKNHAPHQRTHAHHHSPLTVPTSPHLKPVRASYSFEIEHSKGQLSLLWNELCNQSFATQFSRARAKSKLY